MAKIMIIAEKPSVAAKIAKYLSSGKYKTLKYKKVKYYKFQKDGHTIYVVPAAGHLFSLKPIKKGYDYPYFDAKWAPLYEVEKGADYTKDYIELIKEISKSVDQIVVATDYDVEGEVIGYTIVKLACGLSPRLAKRMKFSAITWKDINDAWKNLLPSMNIGMAHAGITRHYLDWYWGINLSRALTNSLKKVSKKLKVLSTGRVQGPTLKLIVDREREIQNFKPEPYWVVKMKFYHDGKEYVADHEKNPFKIESYAKKALFNAKKPPAVVEKIEAKSTKAMPPAPFDLGTLQKEAFRLYKFSPEKTLKIAQKLYEKSYITYPRTSSQKLPKNKNYYKIIAQLEKYGEVKQFCEFLLNQKELKPREGKKDDPAHPAIHPTGLVPKNLSPDEKKIYDLIVKRFLACFYPPAKLETTKITINANGEKFIMRGVRVVERSWLDVYPSEVSEKELPNLKEGWKLYKYSVFYEKKFTEPPSRYTPSSILSKMESLNIGTKATRGQILETLYKRGYIEGRKTIRPTPLGIRTVEALEKYAPKVLSVELTREFEEKMEQIEKGYVDPRQVLEDAKKVLTEILLEMKDKEDEIGRMLHEAVIENENDKDAPQKRRTSRRTSSKRRKAPSKNSRKTYNRNTSFRRNRYGSRSKRHVG